MDSIAGYLEDELKLRVNREKSKVSRPSQSTLLGFSFYGKDTEWKTRIAPKSLKSIKQKIREQTKRNQPVSIVERIKKLDAIIRGWATYFSMAEAKKLMIRLDGMVRTRLRIIMWKQWKTITGRIRNLIKLNVPKAKAYEWANSRKAYCRIANSPILRTNLDNSYFAKVRYTGFADYYHWKTTHQTKLF